MNPYEPPGANEPVEAEGDESDSVTINVAPFHLDGYDLVAGQLPGLLYLWIPAALVAWASNSLVIGGATIAFVIGSILLFTIRGMEISSAGLRFRRLLGHPRFLPWNRVVSIAEASRREVLIHGWTVPRFPPREITSASTTKGHFRIEWSGGWLYFPPAEIDRFCKLVSLHLKRAEPGAPQPRNEAF